MYRMPTLGGLKKAQEFLKSKGWDLPIFQMDIYGDKQIGGGIATTRWIPGKGKTVSLDEMIRLNGPNCRVINVRLTNEQGNLFVEFSERRLTATGIELMGGDARADGNFSVEYPAKNSALYEFMVSRDGLIFSDLVQGYSSRVPDRGDVSISGVHPSFRRRIRNWFRDFWDSIPG